MGAFFIYVFKKFRVSDLGLSLRAAVSNGNALLGQKLYH